MAVENTIIKMEIEEENGEKNEVSGRLVGFISDKECKAIINTEGAARKVFDSESVKTTEYYGEMIGHRFVFATFNLSPIYAKKVFISPIIKAISYVGGGPSFKCGDKKNYHIKT